MAEPIRAESQESMQKAEAEDLEEINRLMHDSSQLGLIGE